MSDKEFSRIAGSNIFVLRPEYVSEVNEWLGKYWDKRRVRTRRRVNDRIMDLAAALAPELLRRMPTDQPIDAQLLKRQAIDLGSTIVAGFIEENIF